MNGKILGRGTCTFVAKIKAAQDAGAVALIIVIMWKELSGCLARTRQSLFLLSV
jgi:hypothetical protein